MLIKKNILQANELSAQKTRELLRQHHVQMLNLIGSPGAGKTSFLEHWIPLLQKQNLKVGVIEGDCQTDLDAQRIAKLNIEVIQINTGSGCHLDAHLVHQAVSELSLEELDVVLVENVGNLVCPVEFDLGEHHKIAIISTTEGADKPGKYPNLFYWLMRLF